MEGREVADGAKRKDTESRVIAQATHEAQLEEAAKAQAMKAIEQKAIGQAIGPTAAPPEGVAKMKGSTEGSSDDEDDEFSSSRRGRSPSRRRALLPAASPPPGNFERSYKPKRRRGPRSPSRASERSEGTRYKVKFAQVVDQMPFDLEDLLNRDPRSFLTSPTIFSFQTRAPETKVVSKLDDIIPTIFRVYYKEGVFSVQAPRPARRKAQGRSHDSGQGARRSSKPPLPAQRHRADRQPAQRQARPPPRPRRSRLVFRSGVLEGACAQDEQTMPFTLWPQASPAAAPPAPPPAPLAPVFCAPRPKKKARQELATHPSYAPQSERVADLLRSIAEVIAPVPTSAPRYLSQFMVRNDPNISFAGLAQSGSFLAPTPVGAQHDLVVSGFGGNGRHILKSLFWVLGHRINHISRDAQVAARFSPARQHNFLPGGGAGNKVCVCVLLDDTLLPCGRMFHASCDSCAVFNVQPALQVEPTSQIRCRTARALRRRSLRSTFSLAIAHYIFERDLFRGYNEVFGLRGKLV